MKQVFRRIAASPRARLAAEFLAAHGHLVALALFLAVGVAALDDYGVMPDTLSERLVGRASLGYILGDEGDREQMLVERVAL